MGLLGEAFFLCLGEFLSLPETLPRRARIASWHARIIKTVPAFSLCEAAWAWVRGILEKSFAEKLNQREDIKAIECNVRLVGLSIGEGYTRFMPKEKLLGAFAGCEEDEILAYGPDGRMMGRFDSLFSLEFVRSDFVASSIPVILSGYKGGLIEVYGKFPLPR